MRRFISGLIICSLSAMPLLKVSSSNLTIVGLSKATAGPFDIIEIYGSGFTAASDMLVIFAKGAYVVAIPPVYGTESALQVPVPFFFNTKSGAINPGVVSVRVKSKSLGIQSNSISGFAIAGLPRSTQPPGTITLAFLEDLKTITGYAKSQLTFLKKASNGKINTTRANLELSKMQATLGGLKTAVASIKQGQPKMGASPIKVTKSSLAAADRLILEYLTQLDAVAKAPLVPGVPAVPGRAAVPSGALSIPSLKQVYEKLASYASEANFDKQKLLEFMKRNLAVVGASASGIALAAKALSLPALATAAGAFALVYTIAMTFETAVDYACLYLGLPSGVTKAQDFLALVLILFDTGAGMATYILPASAWPKQLYDLYSNSKTDIELAKQLVEPVKNSAQTIIRELVRISMNGSWVGSYDSNYGKWGLTANFVQTGQSFSGQMNVGGLENGSVRGTVNGYNTGFSISGSCGPYPFTGTYSGGFSGDGRTISGTFSITVRGEQGATLTIAGTWELSH